jgi:hypothetical protein
MMDDGVDMCLCSCYGRNRVLVVVGGLQTSCRSRRAISSLNLGPKKRGCISSSVSAITA